MSTFALPDLGEGLQEAEIVTWHVAEGDHVVVDQPLVSVETDKAVVEIPSPRAGWVARLFAKPGDRIKVGSPIVMFREGPLADVGAIVGDLADGPAASVPLAAATRPLAAPGVRAFAQERGVDLAQVTGSGPGGAITRADVERAGVSSSRPSSGELLKGMRRSMAINMARAHAEVVPATVWDEADVEAWWSPVADVTARLIRAIAVGCAAAPALNAWFDGKAMSCQRMQRVDLGIAVDTEEGLVVPVLRDVGNRDAAAIRRDLDSRKEAARMRTIALADLRNPTITLSNFGMLVGRHAALVVVPPQVAIVGAGRIVQQAVPRGSEVAFRHMLPLSITFDHRVVTGGDATRFLKATIEDLQQPS
jgi:pyruvate dehydrogenase E2 component (dihydrolipoamide acetyltransferase)